MVAETVVDYLRQRLRDWDVSRIFGYPHDAIDGILAALGRAGDMTDSLSGTLATGKERRHGHTARRRRRAVGGRGAAGTAAADGR